MIREPDAVRKQDTRRIEQPEGFECLNRPHVVAPLSFLHIEFAFVAVSMKPNLMMFSNIHCALIRLGRAVEHMLKSHPHMDSAIRAAMPLLDQCFVGVECFEIIVIWMLSYIRDKHRADTKLRRHL